jgi:hypothetical protein
MKNSRTLSPELMSGLFNSILEFMIRSGVRLPEIEAQFANSMTDQRRGSRKRGSLPAGNDFSAAAAIKIWHNDPRYLNSRARPKALRLRGRTPSVESLAKKACPDGAHASLVSALQTSGMLKRSAGGRFTPSEEYATPLGLHPIAIQHVAKSVVRLVETALRNTHSNGKGISLIERFARVPDLDAREAKAFAEFTRRQGLAYLQSVDDWLETRRLNGKAKTRTQRGGTTGAGVHLFAYIGDEVDDDLSSRLVGSDEESFPHLTWAVPSGNRRAAAPCTTSGVPAGTI